MKIYKVNLHIQSEYGNMRARKISKFEYFSYSDFLYKIMIRTSLNLIKTWI